MGKKLLRLVKREPLGVGIVLLFLLMASVGPVVVTGNAYEVDFSLRNGDVSVKHLLGTDLYGRDILARIVLGSRIELKIISLSMLLAAGIGIPIGLVSGYFGGKIDAVLSRAVDALMAFPPLMLAVAISAIIGASLTGAIVAIGVVSVPVLARITRGEALRIREESYVEAARAIGAGHLRILFVNVLPNALGPLFVQITFLGGMAILYEAGLGFIGLGAQPPLPSWGAMLQEARRYLFTDPQNLVTLGIVVSMFILGFNLIGDELRDLFR